MVGDEWKDVAYVYRHALTTVGEAKKEIVRRLGTRHQRPTACDTGRLSARRVVHHSTGGHRDVHGAHRRLAMLFRGSLR